ncbi:hypothetical protein [Lacisediminihabitans changchengi]|uniref:Uncharacterized protein n=1 Tax=Lacisediminihabitans changchengi TaxID=2787634 RepID=A0A934W3K4_9MICO|nr:hypothetical protein [Lacisediminihabitans changchengi]MBK4346590.1 hypothetical protein [Lacisediminihabitans changchengi]
MKSATAQTLLVVVAPICIVLGLVGLGATNRYESNLALGLFVIGGIAALLRLAIHGQSPR